MRSRTFFLAFLFSIVSVLAFAQEPSTEPGTRRPPALLVRPDSEKPSQPLAVEAVGLKLELHGRLARAELDLTFRNDLDRVLEGSLVLSMPDGGTISDVSLEIEGKLRPGVVVERERARVVFEDVVRRNVDPALVEWVRGNVFRMRVYPIPARGTKRCVVAYEWEVTDDRLILPLAFDNRLKSVRFEMAARAIRPSIAKSPFPGEVDAAWREETSSFEARFEGADLSLEGDLRIDLPELTEPAVACQKGESGRVFQALLPVRVPESKTAPSRAEEVTILYDVSASRADGNRTREKAFLEKLLEASGTKRVRLIPFSNDIWSDETFEVGADDGQALFERFDRLAFDGGTRFGCLKKLTTVGDADLVLLFTDGLGTIGTELPSFDGDQRIRVVSDQAAADVDLLRHLVPQSEPLRLHRLSTDQAVAEATSSPIVFLGAEGDGISDVTPAGPLAVGNTISVCGRVKGNDPVSVRCRFTDHTRTWTETLVVPAAEMEGSRTERAWARHRVRELIPFEAHRETLLRLGLDYGIVTPATSLLVLDSLDDYVRYRVRPPADWVEEWAERLEAIGLQKKQSRIEHLAHLRELWKKRVAWWERTFDVPPDFRYDNPEEKERLRGGGGEEENDDSSGESADEEEPLVEERREVPPGAKKKDKNGGSKGNGIQLEPWNPDTPYLAPLREAGEEAYPTYLQLKKKHGNSSAFFLDVADFFLDVRKNKPLAIRVLSNIAEMDLGSARLLRILAHRLAQMDELERATVLFEEVRRLRPSDPQSHRDLGLVLARRGLYAEAIPLLEQVVLGTWDSRFPEIQLLTLGELNRVVARCRKETGKTHHTLPDDLIQLLDVDLRVTLSWDADNCDMDLWVIEPTGEKAYYSHQRTTIGGYFGPDFTQGYGPEEYWVRKAFPGTYQLKVNYYGNRQQTLAGATTIQITIYKNYGRADEERISITRRLADVEEVLDLGTVEFQK